MHLSAIKINHHCGLYSVKYKRDHEEYKSCSTKVEMSFKRTEGRELSIIMKKKVEETKEESEKQEVSRYNEN